MQFDILAVLNDFIQLVEAADRQMQSVQVTYGTADHQHPEPAIRRKGHRW
jgi:hypothetical protein